jgi:hypothetical protein
VSQGTSPFATLAYVVAVLFVVRWFGLFLVLAGSAIPFAMALWAGLLSPEARHLLELAAVAGRPVRIPVRVDPPGRLPAAAGARAVCAAPPRG